MKINRFKVAAGKAFVRIDGEEKGYRKGQVVEVAHPRDLCAQYPGKFKRLASRVAEDDEAPAKGGKSKPEPIVDDEDELNLSEIESNLGINATDEFPIAHEREVAVFKKGSKYFVSQDRGETAANDKGLAKKAVVAFIDELTDAEDE